MGGHGQHSSSSSSSGSWHKCSYCSKEYPNLQALGGHQTAHRKEIEQLRRLHEVRARESRRRGSRSSSRLVAMRMAAMAREEGPLNLELTLATGGYSGPDLSLRL